MEGNMSLARREGNRVCSNLLGFSLEDSSISQEPIDLKYQEVVLLAEEMEFRFWGCQNSWELRGTSLMGRNYEMCV